MNAASEVRDDIASSLRAYKAPSEFAGLVSAIAGTIERGAQLVEDAGDGARQAYDACNSYSYYSTTTTRRSCPATLGSSEAYREFLIAAKDQASSYDAAVAAFRNKYEKQMRELYLA